MTQPSGLQRFVAEAAIMALVGIVLAVTGAFGTGDLPLATRFAYWIGGLLLAGCALQIVLLATRRVAELLGWRDHWAYALSVPLLAVIIFMTLDMFSAPDTPPPTGLYFQIMLLGAGFFILFGAIYTITGKYVSGASPDAVPGNLSAKGVPSPSHTEPCGLAQTQLHCRLPPAFAPIVALSAEDHYTRVHSAQGSDLILMNLSDAIGAMPADSGLQVHRSWWVTRGAVIRAQRSGRSVTLALTGGVAAPVSRANLHHVRAMGWLE